VFSLSSFGEACFTKTASSTIAQFRCTYFRAAGRPELLFKWPIVNGKAKKWIGGRFGNLPAAPQLFFPTLPDPKLSIDNSAQRFINSMTNL